MVGIVVAPMRDPRRPTNSMPNPHRAHYPQDDSPLCCCEYTDRHGNRSHIFGLLCACEDIDQAAENMFTGKGVGKGQLDEIIAEIDDRMRVPFPGGAWHIGVPGAVPWLVLPFILLFGGISARFLIIAAASLFPILFWWHRRSLRLRKRSVFLFSWMLASLAYETLLYALCMPHRQSELASASFVTTVLLTIFMLLLVKRVDPTSCADACDAAGAAARTYRCAVCSVSVPRYDHYCAWVDEPVGAANHRAYLGFVASMSSTCLLGGAQIVSVVMAGADGWSLASAWQANQSSVMLSFALYAIVIGVAVLTLLVHQLILILSGRTAYEARRAARKTGAEEDATAAAEPPVAAGPATVGLAHHVYTFGMQTRPLSSTVVAALAGRPPAAPDEPPKDPTL